jgi:sulfite reductase beta subunit-like hemoprotein
MAAPSPRPDIPRAKRDGLDLDLAAVCAAGPAALSPEDHYRLKTYGICTQRDADLFMVRLRVTAGELDRPRVAAVAEAARRFAGGWVHLTTRQNVELHSVRLEDVPALYALLEPSGVVGRSACGHTIRNVMACPDAATSVEEPFDVRPDARRLAHLLVEWSRELNVALPSRLNIILGGCADCAQEARTNDIGLVARIREGVPGYQLWAGGSLGVAPRLAHLVLPFVERHDVWPAVHAIVDWFCTEGDVEQVGKSRLKFVIEERGEAAFRAAFSKRLAALRSEPQPPVDDLVLPDPVAVGRTLAAAPTLGWRRGVQPERTPGLATVTVRVPLGDLLADELEAIADLAPAGRLVITKEQNLLLHHVPVGHVDKVLQGLAAWHLGPDGARGAADVRSCPGTAFCSLAITASQPVALAIERALSNRPDLPRDLSIAVSGCPNSCSKQQATDIGLAGGKVKVGGRIGPGYQLTLGADVPAGLLGEPVLRLAEAEVPGAVVSVVEIWQAMRRPGEPPGRTFRRLGLQTVGEAVADRMRPATEGEPGFEVVGHDDTGLGGSPDGVAGELVGAGSSAPGPTR